MQADSVSSTVPTWLEGASAAAGPRSASSAAKDLAAVGSTTSPGRPAFDPANISERAWAAGHGRYIRSLGQARSAR
eukprot:11259116-Alexandrium_andersonii.AAC.1